MRAISSESDAWKARREDAKKREQEDLGQQRLINELRRQSQKSALTETGQIRAIIQDQPLEEVQTLLEYLQKTRPGLRSGFIADLLRWLASRRDAN